jgi:hypothetical protein
MWHWGGGGDVQRRVLASFYHWILTCKSICWSCSYTRCSRWGCCRAAHYQMIIRWSCFSLDLCWKAYPIAFKLSVVYMVLMSCSSEARCSRCIHKTLCIELLRSTTRSNFRYLIIALRLVNKNTSLESDSLSLLLLLIWRKGVINYVLRVWKWFWRFSSLVRSFGFTLVYWWNNVRVIHRS